MKKRDGSYLDFTVGGRSLDGFVFGFGVFSVISACSRTSMMPFEAMQPYTRQSDMLNLQAVFT